MTFESLNAKHTARLVYYSCLSLCCVSCGTTNDGGDQVDEPLLTLSALYDVDVTYLGGRCALGSNRLIGTPSKAFVKQVGNQVTWKQEAWSQAGETGNAAWWSLEGKLCNDAESSAIEAANHQSVRLRLSGGRVYRLAQGSGFCRAELQLPVNGGSCAGADDVCLDANAISLSFDTCTGQWYGQFWTCVRFSEDCEQFNDGCTMLLRIVATPANITADPECPDLSFGDAPSLCDNACSAASSETGS